LRIFRNIPENSRNHGEIICHAFKIKSKPKSHSSAGKVLAHEAPSLRRESKV
jgi:hypothetical protein